MTLNLATGDDLKLAARKCQEAVCRSCPHWRGGASGRCLLTNPAASERVQEELTLAMWERGEWAEGCPQTSYRPASPGA